MPAVLATWITAISTAGFVWLWFRVVREELSRRRNMVESAQLQVLACQKKYVQAEEGETQQAKAILLRSEDIYRQSVALYHRALRKPWNYLPGSLMGFHQVRKHEQS